MAGGLAPSFRLVPSLFFALPGGRGEPFAYHLADSSTTLRASGAWAMHRLPSGPTQRTICGLIKWAVVPTPHGRVKCWHTLVGADGECQPAEW